MCRLPKGQVLSAALGVTSPGAGVELVTCGASPLLDAHQRGGTIPAERLAPGCNGDSCRGRLQHLLLLSVVIYKQFQDNYSCSN